MSWLTTLSAVKIVNSTMIGFPVDVDLQGGQSIVRSMGLFLSLLTSLVPMLLRSYSSMWQCHGSSLISIDKPFSCDSLLPVKHRGRWNQFHFEKNQTWLERAMGHERNRREKASGWAAKVKLAPGPCGMIGSGPWRGF